MKKLLFLAFLLPIAFSLSEAAITTVSSEPARGVDSYYVSRECNLSEAELSNIKDFVINNFNVTDASLVNVSYSYCYLYGDYYSIYVNMIAKKDASDIEMKQISFSLSYNNEIDYDILMNGKADSFDYSLKNKYYSYYTNSTDEEYYIIISYNYDENYTIDEFKTDIEAYYESVIGEKYLQEDYDYPILVFKAKTSELLSILPGFPAYISYYGEDVTFTFHGYSEGTYNLDQIASSSVCNIQNSGYYSYEFSDECYGTYVDKERIYFSAYDYNENYSMYFSLYGIKGYKAEFSASYWGDVTTAEVQAFIDKNLEQYFPEYSFTPEFLENYDSEIIRDFNYDSSKFSGMNMTKDRESTNYYSGNVYASIIEPHISLYSSSRRIYSLDEKIMPPFYGQNTVITKDRVYSSISIKENNEETAKTGLNEMLAGLIEANDWTLNMSLRQYYYYRAATDAGIQAESLDMAGSSVSSSSPNIAGLSEIKTSSFDGSKFDELSKQDSILDLIVNFFKSFFI